MFVVREGHKVRVMRGVIVAEPRRIVGSEQHIIVKHVEFITMERINFTNEKHLVALQANFAEQLFRIDGLLNVDHLMSGVAQIPCKPQI